MEWELEVTVGTMDECGEKEAMKRTHSGEQASRPG